MGILKHYRPIYGRNLIQRKTSKLRETPLRSMKREMYMIKEGGGGEDPGSVTCSSTSRPVTRKGLVSEANTGIDSVNLKISKSFYFDFPCELVFVDVL